MHPVRGATLTKLIISLYIGVSIHAPHAGCEVRGAKPVMPALFQFTHPVRGATEEYAQLTETIKFQFTHPVRGATR